MGILTDTINKLEFLSLSQVETNYLDWVNHNQVLIFKEKPYPNCQKSPHYPRFLASFMAKRGNKRYSYRVRKRFENILSIIPQEVLPSYDGGGKDLGRAGGTNQFLTSVFKKYDPKGHIVEADDTAESLIGGAGANFHGKVVPCVTNVLFVTLTHNRKCSWADAWRNIGKDVNRFLSRLKKMYGRVHVMRCFEAYLSDGFPHVHLVLQFTDKSFPVWIHTHRHLKDGVVVTRTKLIVPDQDNTKFHNSWRNGFVDVEGVENLRKAIGYLGKYVTKCSSLKYLEGHLRKHINPISLRTLACCWVFRKRAFSIGKGFVSWLMSRLDRTNSAIQTDVVATSLRPNWVRSQMLLQGNALPLKFELYTIKNRNVFSNWRYLWNFGLLADERESVIRSVIGVLRHKIILQTSDKPFVVSDSHRLVKFDLWKNTLVSTYG